jgi:hypothetical protein
MVGIFQAKSQSHRISRRVTKIFMLQVYLHIGQTYAKKRYLLIQIFGFPLSVLFVYLDVKEISKKRKNRFDEILVKLF